MSEGLQSVAHDFLEPTGFQPVVVQLPSGAPRAESRNDRADAPHSAVRPAALPLRLGDFARDLSDPTNCTSPIKMGPIFGEFCSTRFTHRPEKSEEFCEATVQNE